MTASFRFTKVAKIDHFWHFWWTFVHSKCKRSSLRSQCWMRLFLWFSNTVEVSRFASPYFRKKSFPDPVEKRLTRLTIWKRKRCLTRWNITSSNYYFDFWIFLVKFKKLMTFQDWLKKKLEKERFVGNERFFWKWDFFSK